MKKFAAACRIVSTLIAFAGVAGLVLITIAETESELGRQDALLSCAVIGLTAVALLTLCLDRGRVKLSLQDLLMAALLGWLGFACFRITETNASTRWIETLWFFILYLDLRIIGTYHGREVWRGALCLLMVCGATEAMIGIRQALGMAWSHHSLFRVTGTFYNPGPYGGFIAAVMSMAFAYLVTGYDDARHMLSGWRWRGSKLRDIANGGVYLLCTATFVLCFMTILSTESRAALVSFIVCALLTLTHVYGARIGAYAAARRKRVAAIAIVAFAVLAAGAAGAYLVKKDSADARLLTWRVMLRSTAEHPVFGTGFGTFEGEYAPEQAEYFAEHPDSRFIAVADAPVSGFNEYLQAGTEAGIPGLLLIVAIVATSFARLRRSDPWAAYGLLSVAVFALFSYPFRLIPFEILMVLFVARAGSASTTCDRGPKAAFVDRWTSAVLLLIVMAVILFVRPWHDEKIDAVREWKEVAYFYHLELYEDCLSDMASLYPLLSDNPRFVFEYGHTLNKAGCYRASNHILAGGARISNDPMFLNVMGNNHKALGEYAEAAECYRRAFATVPNRLYPLYLLMNLYSDTGRETEALEMARRVAGFVPKVESQATREMKADAQKILEATE